MLVTSIFFISHNVSYPFQNKFQIFSNSDFLKCRPVKNYLFNKQSRLLTTLKEKGLENTVGKGENAGNQHFLLFLQCLLLYQGEKSSF